MRRLAADAALLAVVLLAAGCGYHFPGGGQFPAGIKSVHLKMEGGDSPLRRALERQLRRDERISLEASASAADAVLEISGGTVRTRAAALDPQGVATEYQVQLKAGYRLLKRGPDGLETVRERSGLQAGQTYPYNAGNPTADEANRRRAAEQAAGQLATEILRSIREGF